MLILVLLLFDSIKLFESQVKVYMDKIFFYVLCKYMYICVYKYMYILCKSRIAVTQDIT